MGSRRFAEATTANRALATIAYALLGILTGALRLLVLPPSLLPDSVGPLAVQLPSSVREKGIVKDKKKSRPDYFRPALGFAGS